MTEKFPTIVVCACRGKEQQNSSWEEIKIAKTRIRRGTISTDRKLIEFMPQD